MIMQERFEQLGFLIDYIDEKKAYIKNDYFGIAISKENQTLLWQNRATGQHAGKWYFNDLIKAIDNYTPPMHPSQFTLEQLILFKEFMQR